LKTTSISHISHGITETGGYRHEHFFLEKLSEIFNRNNVAVEKKTIRAKQFFKGIAHIKLLWWGFIHSNADINITVARTALSSIVRNIVNQKKTLIILHYFDERDGKKFILKGYYKLLFWLLSNFNFKNVSIIVVAPFWKSYFENKVKNNVPVFLFPNFFDNEIYERFITLKKNKRINLGQYSWKNDHRIFDLAKQLSALGYECYFSSMIKEETGNFDGYDIVLEDRENYLKNMSQSLYTIAFIAINEGWNRVSHESILVGTTLIGNDAGGLGDLINESGSLIANQTQQFIDHILNNHQTHVEQNFIQKYDEQNAEIFLNPIVEFLKK
jgi:hypothetical protein